MGDACGCCTSNEQLRHQHNLYMESLPEPKREKKDEEEEQHHIRNNKNKFQEERTSIYKDQIITKKPDSEQKVIENPISLSLTSPSMLSPDPKKKRSPSTSPKGINRFKNITKQNAAEYLLDLKPSVITTVYVPCNIYTRWRLSHKLQQRITIANDLHIPYNDNKHGMIQ